MRLKSTEERERSENLSHCARLSPDLLAPHLDRARQLRAEALAHLVRQVPRALGTMLSRAGDCLRQKASVWIQYQYFQEVLTELNGSLRPN
jgi:hypothetical protein